MKIILYTLTFLSMSFSSCGTNDLKENKQNKVMSKAKERAAFYVEPYYNADPLKINVGEYSEQLETEDPAKIIALAETIKGNIEKVNVETLFALSTRLYDLQKKDEAVYWYYAATLRRNVFKATVIDNRHGTAAGELAQALDAYKKLLGEYVNGYAFGDIDKNITINEAVMAENKDMKSLSGAYPSLKFDDTKLAEAVKAQVGERAEFIKYMKEHKESIKKQRTENGIDGKY